MFFYYEHMSNKNGCSRHRRRRARCIGFDPTYTCFKPCGVRGRGLDTVAMPADEFEALRLMDYEGLYQEACAEKMGISRATFSRTVTEARRKIADVLLNGKRLLIAAGEPPANVDERSFIELVDEDVSERDTPKQR